MTGPVRPAPRIVPDEPELVPRLERFRADHPEVVILLRGSPPRAWIGRRKIERSTLRALLDELEQTVPPNAPASLAGAPV